MKPPFEKFVVHTYNVNEFIVRVTSPETIRSLLEVGGDTPETEKKLNETGYLSLSRCLFIEDAIREKMEAKP